MRIQWLVIACVVTACGGGGSDVTPPDDDPIANIVIAPDSGDLEINATTQLSATVKDATGNPLTRQLQWTSSNVSIATVTGAGLVKGVSAGRVMITSSAEGKSGSAVVRVRPAADTISGSPNTPAVNAIPLRATPPFNAADFSTGNPETPKVPLSTRNVLLLVSKDATLAQLNAMLKLTRGQIVGGSPGIGGEFPGILLVRLPTSTHAEMNSMLALLRQQPIVLNAQPDRRVHPHVVTAANTLPSPFEWTWELTPSTANWGLEALRVPAMWNLNDAVRRGGNRTITAVFDRGFFPSDDIVFEKRYAPSYVHEHGTHVTGILGATFNNGVGIDGVNPFLRIMTAGGFETLSSLTNDFRIFLDSVPEARVINVSLGYNTADDTVDTNADESARRGADVDGEYLMSILNIVARSRPLPVIVVAAGNDSDTYPNQQARYASPLANAGVRSAAPIIVVEALENNNGISARANYSNVGGHVSAPGSAILSALGGPDYDIRNGTSQATPHVAGIVSYLYALAPTLPAPTMTSNPIRDLLIARATPIPGAAPSVDAFASALDVDRLLGGDQVLRALLDIDDGTLDGNTRVGTNENTDDADGNGGRGDGLIDMSDFRRFRDWFLQATNADGLALNGPPTHPKRDLNGDGVVQTPAKENIYPRGDFNGDGEIGPEARAMPGALMNAALNDLDVLRSRFTDPHYHPNELADLLHSVDITVDASACFARPGVENVLIEVQEVDEPGTIRARVIAQAHGTQMFTEHFWAPGHRVIVSILDDNFQKVGEEEITAVQIPLGGDAMVTATCQRVDLTLAFPLSVQQGVATQLTVRAGEKDLVSGAVTFKAGIQIALSATGGTVASSAGVTAADGRFITTATLGNSSNQITINATATITGVGTRKASVTAVKAVLPLTMVSVGLPAGVVGTPYDQGLVANGGAEPYQWSITAGSLPAGLTLNGTTGRVTGTPSIAGGSTFTVRVQSGQESVSRQFVINIALPNPDVIYDGQYTNGQGTQDARVFVYPVAGGKTCIAIMFPSRTLHSAACNGSDLGAFEGTFTTGAFTAVSTGPGGKTITGTISSTTLTFTGQDPFSQPISFTGTKVP